VSLVAPRLDKIKPSPTIATSIRASELKAAGRDVISLGYGEPDFNTPEHIKEAAIEALRSDQTKYTPVNGIVPLRQAICRKFKRENGVEYKIDQIAVGGVAANNCCTMHSLQPSLQTMKLLSPHHIGSVIRT
jgi:aspartate aminotransferase